MITISFEICFFFVYSVVFIPQRDIQIIQSIWMLKEMVFAFSQISIINPEKIMEKQI